MFEKLKKNEDFKKVYKDGKSFSSKFIVICIKKNKFPFTRIGVSCSKKIKKAVNRNFLKRRVSEILRKIKIKDNLDLVCILREKAGELCFLKLKEEILMCLEKLNILMNLENES